MRASDLRIAHRAAGWVVVDVTAGKDVTEPFVTSGEAIQARQQLALAEVNGTVERTRRSAAAYSKELASVNSDA